MIADKIQELTLANKVTPEEIDILFQKCQAFNSLQEVMDWANAHGHLMMQRPNLGMNG